jgi:hypothetical protein
VSALSFLSLLCRACSLCFKFYLGCAKGRWRYRSQKFLGFHRRGGKRGAAEEAFLLCMGHDTPFRRSCLFQVASGCTAMAAPAPETQVNRDACCMWVWQVPPREEPYSTSSFHFRVRSCISIVLSVAGCALRVVIALLGAWDGTHFAHHSPFLRHSLCKICVHLKFLPGACLCETSFLLKKKY